MVLPQAIPSSSRLTAAVQIADTRRACLPGGAVVEPDQERTQDLIDTIDPTLRCGLRGSSRAGLGLPRPST